MDSSTISVIGTGTMGPGIGAVLARAGHQVVFYDTSAKALEAVEGAAAVADGILDRLDIVPIPGGSIRVDPDLAGAVAGASLVLEAIPEQLDLKRRVFGELEALTDSDTILASNTSGLRITDIAAGLKHPERVVGMHWSNPPHLVPMIEVVPGEETSQATVDAMVALVAGFGYDPVVENEVMGFVENRILYAIMRECLDLVDAGVADQEAIDRVVRWGIGYKLAAIGPMALIDMAGVDIYHAVASYLNDDLSRRRDVADTIGELVAEGRLGMKTLGGLFDYTEDSRADLARERADTLVRLRKALSP